MLTKRQKQILDYFKQCIKENGYAPTLEETRRHFRLSSKSTIHKHIEALRLKGYLDKLDYQARAIDISQNKKSRDLIEIPLLGIIAAGQPIEAIEDNETITVPKSSIGSGKHFALKVQGNSMIGEGIFDGDVVIIREQKSADNGQTVVAIIDENEATLKKIYKEKEEIRLQPANPSLFPIYRKEVEIRGLVVQIIRNLEPTPHKKQSLAPKIKRKINYAWDFRNGKTKPYTHGFHTYPAMFIPQIARRLLLIYSKKGDTICDIFCGSGTALIEAKLLSRNAYGIDLNPLATFLANVKTTPLNPSILQRYYLKTLNRINNIKNVKIPNFFNINYWFKEKIITDLAKIKKAILEIKNKDIRNFFLVAFSETARLVSNSRNGEFKLFRIKSEELDKYNPNTLEIFKTKVEKNIKGMTEYYKDIDKNAWTKVIPGDSSQDNGIKENSIDCIITSPPYGDSRTTVAYGQFSRLSLQWLDLIKDGDLQIDNKLLGGERAKTLENNLPSKNLKNVINRIAKIDKNRSLEVLSFFIDLNKCLQQAYKILKPQKYFCLVIGNRTVKQIKIPTDFIITELAESIGFKLVEISVRNIPNKRMPLKNSPTNIAGELTKTISKESIVILQKI